MFGQRYFIIIKSENAILFSSVFLGHQLELSIYFEPFSCDIYLKVQNNDHLSIVKFEFCIFAHYFKHENNDTTSR
ncbi:hypothetical protein SAMN04488130_107139 [Flavobacterium urumqiense]|uniref:Uncharacterized protein n=1 Tax=Flavobacterium urumqiense TaxID=935224 RepID=A0A1H5YAE0_9FLAO|nr:hypothetical protein SAMN04488130_107139 [Flavobacterium urumqiense]